MSGQLRLVRIPGEARGELVLYQSWGAFSCWVKHEYAAAPWEWILVEGNTPVAFGDCPDQEAAEAQLTEALQDLCPEFAEPTHPIHTQRPGLLTRLWRAL